MELFFSYGHDVHAPLVKRLAEDLKKPENGGHTVWVDFESIDDTSVDTYDPVWRNSITNGINKSDIVLAFASTYALRDKGVCYDELKIAVFVRRAFVQTLLLEEEAADYVPARIAHREYIYLNEWSDAEKEYPSDDAPKDPDFEEWYASKLAKIKEKLARPEIQIYHDELKRIDELLNPRIDTSKQDELAKSSFVGREWLSEMVREWAEGNESGRERALLITGSPGMGKSAFVVNEFMRSPDVAAAVFCRFNDRNANNIDDIACSIAYQMAARYDDFRKRLLAALEKEEAIRERGNEPKGSVFDRYVFNIASELIDGNREYFIILIDGLDEVKLVDGENPVAEALERELRAGRDFVRFVLTSRNEKHVLEPLERVHEIIDLDAFTAEGKVDIESYVKGKLNRERKRNPEIAKRTKDDPSLAQRIIEASDGNFLYATFACSQIDQLPTEGKLPEGLSYFYKKAMERLRDEIEELDDEIEGLRDKIEKRGGEANFETVREALGIIAASDGDIPEETLRRAVGWDEGRGRRVYDKFLNCLSMYITENQEASGDEPTLSFFHKSFADWLISRAGANYSEDRKYSRELLAKACLSAYEESIEDGSFNDMNDYEVFNLIPLLSEYRKEFKEVHRRVLSDSAFFDDLLKRAEKHGRMQQVAPLERIAASFPACDYNTLIGNTSLATIERQRGRMLKRLVELYLPLLRDEDAIRAQKEVVDIQQKLMAVQSTGETIGSYEAAITNYVMLMFDSGVQLSQRRYEEVRIACLEGIDTLKDLSVDRSDDANTQKAILSIYESLVYLAMRFDLDDAASFASELVKYNEMLIRSHIFEAANPFNNGDFYIPYVLLAKAYAKIDQGEYDRALEVEEMLEEFNELYDFADIGDYPDLSEEEISRAQAISQEGLNFSRSQGVLQDGMNFLIENLSFEEASIDRKCSDTFGEKLNHLWYKNLNGIYASLLDITRSSEIPHLRRALYDRWLDFIDERLWDLDLSPLEKTREIIEPLDFYLMSQEDKISLIGRIKPWLESLDLNTNDQAYLSSAPRESLAELLASVDMFEDSIAEYSVVLDRLRAIKVERGSKGVQLTRINKIYDRIATQYERMGGSAVGNECASEAIRYKQLALNETKKIIAKNDESLESALRRVEPNEDILKAFDGAYGSLIWSLLRDKKFSEACKIAKERVETYEGAFSAGEKNGRGKNLLRLAYDSAADCCEQAEDIEEAIAVTRKSKNLLKDDTDFALYRRALGHLERLYRIDGQWSEVGRLSLEQLSLAQEAARGNLKQNVDEIIRNTISYAEFLIRQDGLDSARTFLMEKRFDSGHVYRAILESERGRKSVENAKQDIQQRIESSEPKNPEIEQRLLETSLKLRGGRLGKVEGEFDDPNIGYQLIELISEWSGVEAPESAKEES